jgi:mono/diheme cytochrome c family protein
MKGNSRKLGKRLTLGLGLVVFLTAGCSYRKEKQDLGALSGSLSYSNLARSVFSVSCVGCHGNSGGVNLETYAAVQAHLTQIEQVVFQAHSMPKAPSPPLSDAQLSLLQAWILAGAPENAGNDNTPPPVLVPTFASIHDLIFAKHCVQCHNPTGKAKDVPLDSIAAITDPSLDIVEAGSPDSSQLIKVLSPGANKPMPPPDSGFAQLKPEEVDVIRQWIQNGAKD